MRVGDSVRSEREAAVRLRSGEDLGPMPPESFIARIKGKAESRKDVAE